MPFKIDLSTVGDEFHVRHKEIAGENLILINPQVIGTTWTPDNLHLRSSIWDANGNLVSPSFKKFFNYSEAPNIYRQPHENEAVRAMEKLDGSTFIVSPFKNTLIKRTRGSFDTTEMLNHHEIQMFEQKYAHMFNLIQSQNKHIHSFCFEWTSPSNKIVVNYDEPELRLIGALSHDTYEYMTQDALDNIAADFKIGRPRSWRFKNAKEVTEYINDLSKFGVSDSIFEGFVLYYGKNEQLIRKVKTDHYIKLHKFKEKCNIETVLDLFIEHGRPAYNEMYAHVMNAFDFECAEMARGEISICVDANKEVEKIVTGFVSMVNKVKNLPTRKDMAIAITQAYGSTNRAGYVFDMLNKAQRNEDYSIDSLNKDQITKLFWQVLKR